MALLMALVLLTLSAALLAGAFAASRGAARSARSTRLIARVDTGARRALGEVVQSWGTQLDELAVGTSAEPALPDEPGETGPALVRNARVRRLTERLYVVSVDVRAFERTMPVARRRALIMLERPARTDSLAPMPRPLPLRRWSVADLY